MLPERSPTLFDAEGLQHAAQQAFGDVAGSLQYGAPEGAPAWRHALARLCESRGISCTPSQIMVTPGSQQAFDLRVRILVDPGTPMYIQSPAYAATILVLRLAPAKAFFIADGNVQAMRLSFATPTVEQIQEGCARLARAIRA